MQFTPDPELREAALEALRNEYKINVDRPGLHQSALSGCLTRAYHDKTDFIPPTDKSVGFFVIGFAFERVLLASEENRPESFEVDGITLSLDTKNLFGPADLKTTRKNPNGRKGENGFQPPASWPVQFKAYRYGLNRMAAVCRSGNYCWIHGDKEERCPEIAYDFGVIVLHLLGGELMGWRYTFTPEELDENWQWLLQRKRQLEWMLAHEDAQPFQHNADWECLECVYSLRCGLQASLQGLQKPVNVLQLSDYQ